MTSNELFFGLYGLCEGQIAGLADGGKSIRLDGTPIIGENQQINLAGIEWDFRAGSIDQTPISGFAMVENEMAVGVELRSDKPFVRTINNRELSAVRVCLNFNALKQHHEKATLQDMPSAMPLTYKPMAVHSNRC